MSFAENPISNLDFCKSEEYLYQLSEAKYHLKYIKLSLEEVAYHLKKFKEHASLLNDSKKINT